MRELSFSNPVYASERDFERAIKRSVERFIPGARVENPRRFGGIRIDLGLDFGEESVAIELKYKTRKYEIISNGRHFALKHTSAQGEVRYDFVKDITRVESYVRRANRRVGWAIILTNDHLLWEPHSSGASEEFRIADGLTLSGTRRWKEGCAISLTPRGADLNVLGVYHLNWQEYSDLPGKWGRFRYLAVKIGAEDVV